MSSTPSDHYVFPPAVPSVPVRGTDQSYPVRRLFCVGRNYAAHAREMGFSDKEAPFFFTKPADALVPSGATVPYPLLTEDLHHEIELVLAIKGGGMNIAPEDAMQHVYGVGVGIDLTRRDLQIAHREKGRPWCWGKAFDHGAPMSAITPMSDLPPALQSLDDARIWLSVNDEVKQDGNLNELIWPVADIIAFCSQSVELKTGDLIYTGTPAGVSAVSPGDVLKGGVEGIDTIEVTIANHRAGEG